MNKPIRRLAMFCMVLFGALLINVNVIQALDRSLSEDDLTEHPRNGRQVARQLNTERGPIIAGDENIAFSEETEEGAAYDYQRVYVDSEYYSHITGFYSLFNRTGIERAENSLMDGSDGRLFVRNFIDTITGEESRGASVELTINPDAQQAALDGLRQAGEAGAVVALDPSTGAILAAASLPTYDANILSDLDGSVAGEYYETLEDENADQPLLFRALNERYPPGSTFKVVTAAAALENGFSPNDTMDAPETMPRPEGGNDLPNAFGGPCNGGSPDSLAHSLEISCNTSFANWAMELGSDAMVEQAEAFGFQAQATDSPAYETPLPVTESLYPVPEGQNQLFDSGIGQGQIEATPMQMAMVAAGVANGGEVMQPYLVESVRGPDLSELVSADPTSLGRAVSSGTANQLTEMMVQVTEGDEGSGRNGAIQGIQVAGKTGTAEAGEGRSTHNWFISFAPADDPQVAVAVVIEEGGGSGGELAAPVARNVMEAVLAE